MRLINVQTLKFEEFFDNAVPEYAILSHTWGDAEDAETCNEARRHRLDYVWIDTCCIDKTSSPELSEAINSMFCQLPVESMPRLKAPSRWFTRGWTLQSFLPLKLSRVCLITGIDEVYLVDSVYETRTGLLQKESIAERMSWASQRTTRRKEDIAYSLLGIFGVNMPLIYGEGGKAFLRLQEEIMRSAFNPTLLCWNAEVNGKPQLPQDAKPFYSWT
ncbi:hypothetical protein B0J13DRAFT_585727 [Dactylonectria estremocensis]|uniref:Heterokaryon incompatibility domain-containing protein n=1 Tax=Dactylonectria estremocensis TaxID=1079267 RepID=A0A9P9EPN4_9HYPO|nr:hypothetical protein B0J13DRAFT_585727 [Dactylonectria estremocensis]